jgi:hypothetical protein
MRLVTFTTWADDFGSKTPKSITINPNEVSDVEDYCGASKPGSMITLKNKKTYLVAGVHEDIVAALNAARKLD